MRSLLALLLHIRWVEATATAAARRDPNASHEEDRGAAQGATRLTCFTIQFTGFTTAALLRHVVLPTPRIAQIESLRKVRISLLALLVQTYK